MFCPQVQCTSLQLAYSVALRNTVFELLDTAACTVTNQTELPPCQPHLVIVHPLATFILGISLHPHAEHAPHMLLYHDNFCISPNKVATWRARDVPFLPQTACMRLWTQNPSHNGISCLQQAYMPATQTPPMRHPSNPPPAPTAAPDGATPGREAAETAASAHAATSRYNAPITSREDPCISEP